MTASTILNVGPLCLAIYVDETRHEEFADAKYPVFGFGGCMVLGQWQNLVLDTPWRKMKEQHFGGADVPLHAADLRSPTPGQLAALNGFFSGARFRRFHAVVTDKTLFPSEEKPYAYMAPIMNAVWLESVQAVRPVPKEFALVFESSQRGNPLIERLFSQTGFDLDGKPAPIALHVGEKKSAIPGLEVADFIAQAAGRQACRRMADRTAGHRKDYAAIFPTGDRFSVTFFVDAVKANGPAAAGGRA